MTAQPEALRLADALTQFGGATCYHAAAELRRLQAERDELLEALKQAADAFEIASSGGGVNFYQYARELRAAIAKAEVTP